MSCLRFTENRYDLNDVLDILLHAPVGLDEDPVDIVDTDGLCPGSDRLNHAGEAQIPGLSQYAVAAAYDQA